MHIPDGYISPQTAGFFYCLMAPIWYFASKALKKSLDSKMVPYLAIAAAFTFVIMIFDIPIPGGSSAHPTGAVLVAILLGPAQAVVALTVTLVIQAFLFGDGGILALGANCFNMAFAMPVAGYFVYRLISYRSPAKSMRRVIAAGLGGYVGINVAVILTAAEIGIQPMLHHAANGQALYCPYGFNVTLPAMMTGHLLIFGWVEALITALVVAYVHKNEK